MTLDPNAPGPEAAPLADTPPSDPPDTQPDTQPSAPADYEKRYRDAQSYATKLAQEKADLARQLAQLQAPAGADDQQEAPARGPSRAEQEAAYWQEQALLADTERAESIHGPEAVEGYRVFQDLVEQGNGMPTDLITAFVAGVAAYGKARGAGASPAQAAAVSRSQAVQPRVDLNQPSAPPADQLEATLQEAQAKGPAGLRDFTRTAVEALGFRRG